MSGASVNISLEDAACAIIKLTGTLTQACNVILPAFISSWIIVNNTTGSYTVQVKTASGTGVNVTQGQSTSVYGDGSNIYFSDSAKVASFNGRVGTITLTSSDVTGALGFTPIAYAVGTNQTWQDLTSSRTTGVTYTNSTPSAIAISVVFTQYAISTGYGLTINGLQVDYNLSQQGSNSRATVGHSFIIPAGATYSIDVYGSTGLTSWFELR